MPFNIYQFATWARGTILPLTILSARKATRPLPPERRLDELFPQGRNHPDHRLRRKHRWISWEGPFYLADRLLRGYSGSPIQPGRETAIRLCLEWIIKHQESDGSWAGIQPLDLCLDGLEPGGILPRPSGGSGWKPRVSTRTGRMSARGNLSPGQRVAGLGHGSLTSSHARLRLPLSGQPNNASRRPVVARPADHVPG